MIVVKRNEEFTDFAMTPTEIGRELGMTKAAVTMMLNRALRKLRRRPEAMERLRQLVIERQRIRA